MIWPSNGVLLGGVIASLAPIGHPEARDGGGDAQSSSSRRVPGLREPGADASLAGSAVDLTKAFFFGSLEAVNGALFARH